MIKILGRVRAPVILVFFSGFLFACQTYNSSSGDKVRYGSGSIDTTTLSGQKLAAATDVMRNRCYSCHSVYGGYTTSDQWIASGYIVPGNLSGSTLYVRLYGSSANPSANMPQGGTLSQTELKVFQDWITSL